MAEQHNTSDTTPRIGLEIADSAMRLTVTLGGAPGARRWHTRLGAPPEPAEALDAIHALIARALADETANVVSTAIGVAFWGAVDAARSQIAGTFGARLAPGWESFPLGERLAARWGGPVRIETATNAAALAEARLGAGRGYDGVLYALLGRSVTSALVIGGRVWRGASGRAGLLGHWLAYPETQVAAGQAPAPRCICGMRGHLDPIASAQSLTRNMIGRASDDDASHAAMLRISGRRAEAMTAPQVVELAALGDPAAVSVLKDALVPLSAALANLIAVLDPGVIVIGGPLADAGDRFYAPLRERVAALTAPYRQGVEPPPIIAGALEPFAALRGAMLVAGATTT